MDPELKTASIAYEGLRDSGVKSPDERVLADVLSNQYGWPKLPLCLPLHFRQSVIDVLSQRLSPGRGEECIHRTWTITENDLFEHNYCPDFDWLWPLEGRASVYCVYPHVEGICVRVTAIVSQRPIMNDDVCRAIKV